ncbi:MAG: hypothetical protein AAFN77_18520 [Planctomycetota bacterium]
MSSSIAFHPQEIASTSEQSVDVETIRQLIKQLGDDKYAVRKIASTRLAEIGVPALNELKSAIENHEFGDLESRLIAEELLKQINIEQTRSLAEAFRLGTKELPGWKEFTEIAGDDDQARGLYAAMYEAKGYDISNAFERKQTMLSPYRIMSTASSLSGKKNESRLVGTIATAMFLGCARLDEKIQGSLANQSENTSMIRLLYRSNIAVGLRQSEFGDPTIELVKQYFARLSENRYLDSHLSRMYATIRHPGFLNKMFEIAGDIEQPAAARFNMIAAISQIDAPDQDRRLLESLSELFNDDTQKGPYLLARDDAEKTEFIIHVQLRDVALLASVLLENRAPEEFGFQKKCLKSLTSTSKPTTQEIDPRFAGFADNESREEAFRRWRSREPKSKRPNTNQPVPQAGLIRFGDRQNHFQLCLNLLE